jgi:ABC-type multidrug transport system ATPase subunit
MDNSAAECARYGQLDRVSDVEVQQKSLEWRNEENHNIYWENVSWNVDMKTFGGSVKGKKQILNSVSGLVNTGNLLAIMGPSGCGYIEITTP